MVHAVEKLFDVAPPYKGIEGLFEEVLRALNGSQKSFAHATGPGVINEGLIVNGGEMVVDESVTTRSRMEATEISRLLLSLTINVRYPP
mgnify:CR=1 FL=1